MGNKKEIGIHYGILSDKIEVQLEKQGYKDKKIDIHNRILDGINTLHIKDYITDKQKTNMINKLHKDIIKNLEEL